jgi:glutamate/tyrosine decarboxylase-like PLP-dependent enzyme
MAVHPAGAAPASDRTAHHIAALESHFEPLRSSGAFGLPGPGSDSLEGWFLGPKAENVDVLKSLICAAIDAHAADRRAFHPEDPEIITPEVKSSAAYQDAVRILTAEADQLLAQLKESVPFYSMRYQGHMNWETTLPAIVGYFAAMLYNQNNVAVEASPVTTKLEMEVGNDLCRLVGFDAVSPVPWGHITCDGTVANLESFWAARNLKLFPVALKAALIEEPSLAPARELDVQLLDGSSVQLIELDTWTLLNLTADSVLGLPQTMQDDYGVPVVTTNTALGNHSVQNLGLYEFRSRYLGDVPGEPVALAPITKHYSWPKAASVFGIGASNILDVLVDVDCRMEMDHLREILGQCLQQRQPVLMTVAVIGSTEESAVDPLRGILALREEVRASGLDFVVHADAAWGGYIASVIREDDPDEERRLRGQSRFVPTLPMSRYVTEQYESLGDCDSVTIDPHKAGYIPYPAGGLCYRNSAMRNLVSFTAPVVFHNVADPTVGIYGIEGSKPGAAPTAVYLSHRVIPATKRGYGKLLGECLFTAKRLYAQLVTMTDERFAITCFNRLPAQRAGDPPPVVEAQLQFIRDRIVGRTNEQILADPEAMALFQELGSEQLIVAYAFNALDADGRPNTSLDRLNALNSKVFDLLSLTIGDDVNKKSLIVTSSEFEPDQYGPTFMASFRERLGVQGDEQTPITFLLSTVMDPWTTETPQGSFLTVIEQALRDAVHTALDGLQ